MAYGDEIDIENYMKKYPPEGWRLVTDANGAAILRQPKPGEYFIPSVIGCSRPLYAGTQVGLINHSQLGFNRRIIVETPSWFIMRE